MRTREQTRLVRTMGLNPSREFQRSQRHKECEAKGFHLRSGKVEDKTLGGTVYPMELCAYCDVWVMMHGSKLMWKQR